MTNDAVLKLEFLVTVAVSRLGVLRSSESDSWTPHWQARFHAGPPAARAECRGRAAARLRLSVAGICQWNLGTL
jgi:hypothetical protein